MKTLLLFDIDGTLLRTGYAGRNSIAKAFREVFDAGDSIDSVDFLGRSDPEIFHNISRVIRGVPLSAEEYERVTGRYLSLLPGALASSNGFCLLPGVPELLQVLAARDTIVLGLQTGNLEQAARMKLEYGGIGHYFEVGGFGTDSNLRHELILKGIERARELHPGEIAYDRTYIIDDTPYGISSGQEAGVKTIAVGTGWTKEEDLRAASPSCFLPDMGDIPSFLHCTDCEEP